VFTPLPSRSSLLFMVACALPNLAAAEPLKLPLWTGDAPIGNGAFAPSQAALTVHFAEHPNGVAMVICPGGGYGGLVTGGEGHGIAAWLNTHGITGIVLEYRLPKGNSFLPLADAQRALRTVRSHAADWKINPEKIGIIGFSAGGHLASTAGTHFDNGNPQANEPLERVSCRPDFMVLVYPVVTMGAGTHAGSRKNLLGENPSAEAVLNFSNETKITANTPPAFLAHAADDKAVPLSNSANFYAALQAAKVPSKFLELPSGGHGLNGYKGPMWDRWQTESLEWLGQIGMTAHQ